MIFLLFVNYIVSLFIFEGNLITNIIGSIYFCEYSGWMMIVYAIGNGLSAFATAIVAFNFYLASTIDPEVAAICMTWFYIYLGITIFYIAVFILSIIYSDKAVKVGHEYTAFQISTVDRSRAWKK